MEARAAPGRQLTWASRASLSRHQCLVRWQRGFGCTLRLSRSSSSQLRAPRRVPWAGFLQEADPLTGAGGIGVWAAAEVCCSCLSTRGRSGGQREQQISCSRNSDRRWVPLRRGVRGAPGASEYQLFPPLSGEQAGIPEMLGGPGDFVDSYYMRRPDVATKASATPRVVLGTGTPPFEHTIAVLSFTSATSVGWHRPPRSCGFPPGQDGAVS